MGASSLGTGSVGEIKLADGRHVEVGGWGFPAGDEASGAWMGLRAINHVQQVRLLERDLQSVVPALDEEGLPDRLRIALNGFVVQFLPTVDFFDEICVIGGDSQNVLQVLQECRCTFGVLSRH